MHAWLVAAGMAGYPRTLEGVGWDTENTVKEVERYAMGGRFGCVLGGFKVGLDGLRAGHTLERLNKLVAATKMPKEYKGVTFRRVRVSAEGQIRVEDGQVKDWEGAGKSRWGFFKEKDLEDLVRRVNSRRERQLAMARK
ncbi:hypothetical protein BJ508DRAFT_419148 [Ascobolus immersus RN42]|uniref:Uncharacterized protein n=1 Tax=Ascobolus immersus RN42 TaxID=1160509 RepID=A0A3N4HGL0_ASCIM|nr:hypothetical protein BJ508DRAFT_419148 [Ascobolus immersus RN42]